MNENHFWEIIEKSKEYEDQVKAMKTLLYNLELEEIISYQEHFDYFFENAFKWNLWGAAFFTEGGCSDDQFIDFRYGLISRGREIYSNALENPDSLADIEENIPNELFGYAALEVFEKRTGKPIPRKKNILLEEPNGHEWDFENEDEIKKWLPKLWDRKRGTEKGDRQIMLDSLCIF